LNLFNQNAGMNRHHGKTEVLPTDTPQELASGVQRAAHELCTGGVVALPTETVYGLAANAFDPDAVRKIFDIKGRPAHNPIIVHVDSLEMARKCVAHWTERADKLAHAFWPGPLTLVLPKSDLIPPLVTAGGNTVGIRWPSHPLMQAVIRACGFPLAAPSANLSNQVSPTNARHVCTQLAGRLGLVLDGGQCQVGIESTVVDIGGFPARLLRPGMIHDTALQAVLPDLVFGAEAARGPLKSPGQLKKHYAPKAQLLVLVWESNADLRAKLATQRFDLASCHVIAHTQIPSDQGLGRVSVIPHDPEAFARALYSELHACDHAGAGTIIVEAPPKTPEWRAIADRLRRAAVRQE
jgi:L-threonylcarbamoyladenylate synthase